MSLFTAVHPYEDQELTMITFQADSPTGRESYQVMVSACQNPVCTCDILDLTFVPLEKPDENVGSMSFHISDQKVINDRVHVDPIIADSVTEQLSDDDWRLLSGAYYGVKRDYTEMAKLSDIDASFPHESIEAESTLVRYAQILPYSARPSFCINGQTILMDDQYCVRSHCNCANASIAFLPLSSEKNADQDPLAPKLKAITVNVNYNERSWELINSAGHDRTIVQAYADAIDSSHRKQFQERHQTLRQLYKQYKKRHRIAQATRPNPKRPTAGRNEPCPCGSGKKYKRCCLSKVLLPEQLAPFGRESSSIVEPFV